jgi:TrmH family RNA methyltransferase
LPPIQTARAAAAHVAAISAKHRVGLLFGREDSGLTNEELTRCHLIASIPAARRHPSLNLAQAVMLFCYEIFQASLVAQPALKLELAETDELEALYAHIVETLRRAGFRPYHDDPETFIRSLRRVFSRGLPEKRDVKTLHRIFAQIDLHLRNEK